MPGLKIVTPPAAEPVTLEEMKVYLRLDGDAVDSILGSLITAAREYCEAFQNRALAAQTWEMTFDAFPAMPLRLPKPPLQSVESIKYIDSSGVEAALATGDYIVDTDSEPGRVAFTTEEVWPSVILQPINGVRIRFTAGYTTIPEAVKNAIKVFVAHRFENPDSEDVPSVVRTLLCPERCVPV